MDRKEERILVNKFIYDKLQGKNRQSKTLTFKLKTHGAIKEGTIK